MSVALPYSMDYTQQHLSLPENITSTNVTLNPVNGATFSPSSVIIFDFLNRGFIDPQTIYLRYKWAVTTATGAEMIGTPVYTPFVRLETLIGSTVVESQNQYNQNCHLLVNLTTDVASKYGMQNAYGYTGNTGVTSLADMDGRTMIANETGSFSGLLPGLLSNCEKMIPAFAMSQIRVQLTMDSLANMFAVLATPINPTAFTLSNVELCYTMVDAGPAVENMVRSLGTFYIKSQSIANSSVSLANATTGSISLVYNQRLASVKSAYVLFTGTSTASLNKWADFYDPTSSNGELNINVGGIQYPQRPLSTLNNKNGILQFLRNATGSIYDKSNTLSINSLEWNRQGNDTTTTKEPAKMIFGINLEKVHTPALLTGISTQNSAITVQLSTSTATAQTHTVNLLLAFDALIEVDTATRMVSVKQ